MNCAVYRQFDADGRLLYVGISNNPLARLEEHMARSPWATQMAAVTLEWFDGRGPARLAEVRAIATGKPIHNIKSKNADPDAGQITALIELWDRREDFANAVGVTLVCVHRWAQRNRIPSEYLRAVVKAAQAAGHVHVTAEWIIDALADGTTRAGRECAA